MGTAITQDDMNNVGLGEVERAALAEAEAEEKLSTAEADRLANLKDDDKDEDPAAKEAAEKAAKEAAEKAAAEKAEADAKAAREAELAAMNAEERAKAEAADKAAAEKAAAEKAAQEAADKAKTDTPAPREEPFIATYQAEPVADYDKKVSALEQREKDAEVKFKAGELTFDEFRKEERAVQAERRTLDEQRLKHEISTESTEQSAAARWKWECDRFMRDAAKADGVDYGKNPRLYAALDAEVRRLGQMDEHKDKPGVWFLEEAHKAVLGDIGRTPGKADPKDDAKKKADAIAKEKKEREEAAGKAARTLQGLPPATGADDVKDEFAHLDGLSGLDLERELAKMPKETADKYLQG